jgi:hypothetical protein
MRTLFIALFLVLFSMPALAQTAPPAWPEIALTSCPKIVPLDPSKKTWTSQAEQNDFGAASQMLQAKNYVAAKEGFARFAEQFPYSNYRDVALVSELNAQGYLKDETGVAKTASELVSLPEGNWLVRETGFVNLATLFSVYVRPDDPERERKLADLEKWALCGRQALAARALTTGMPQAAFEKSRQMSEGYLDRADGFAAMMRQQYEAAEMKLETAYSLLNSQDALTCLLLFETRALSLSPDLNGSVFYLARWATLEPEADAAVKLNFLKQVYVIDHGSEKGLSDVLAVAKGNTIPPPGFNILPQPKEKHHYGSVIAATAIIGLFAFEMAKHPDVARGIASSFSAPAPAKFMIFGGQSHRVYLGCLNCAAIERDSIYNGAGVYGSRVLPESIWSRVGDYGSRVSPFSVCNPVATEPPVIVDDQGNDYGRLTLNRVSPNIGAGVRFYEWLSTVVCQR